jgi:hypothetical protein
VQYAQMLEVQMVNFFDLLRHKYPENLQKTTLQEPNCFVRNPVSPGRKIFFFHCMVHILKAIQNNLHNSSVSPKKNSTNSKSLRTHPHNNPFGWEVITNLFHFKNKRSSSGLARLTRLRHEDVELDSWRKMRVGSAKKIFAPETIRKILLMIIQDNKLPVRDKFCEFIEKENQRQGNQPDSTFDTSDNELFVIDDGTQNVIQRTRGNAMQTVYQNENENLVSNNTWQQKPGQCAPGILYERIIQIKSMMPIVSSEMFCAEFMCIIHYIFIDFFLHKQKRIDGENIIELKEIIFKKLMYFVHWRVNQYQAKQDKQKDWVAMFLSTETWRNLLTSVNGFLLL